MKLEYRMGHTYAKRNSNFTGCSVFHLTASGRRQAVCQPHLILPGFVPRVPIAGSQKTRAGQGLRQEGSINMSRWDEHRIYFQDYSLQS